ncbi:ATP-binding cassette domain-containing protein [Salinibaculum rarum]|uniref:ATP-binding cassette domain-containing protein n=1 Tax=Salinibaculum rarum TaxID=3058903 RepID=UPI00265D729B|nr:ATP-binding cassette domain-containing protein [Salinibaculum sp. KK48]
MIRLDDVSVAFGDLTVLDEVSCQVEPGEFVGLVGPNGAGKTTLLRTINGVLSPDSGTVTLEDERVSELSSRAVGRRVATVPQDTHIGFSFTAEQVVEMGRTPHRSRLDWSDHGDPVEEALVRTETTDLRDRTVEELSGGERQRVLLARALAQETPALVLDEPTASLDINHQIQVLDIVRGLVDDGRAAVAAIHDLDLAARYCDRLVLLQDGGIRASGPPDAVLADPSLEEAFDTQTAVTRNPVTGTSTVAALTAQEETDGHVHVVGGGNVAAQVVGECWRAGFDVTVGVVTEGDVAADTARQLDVECLTAPPFESPPEGTRQRAVAAIDRADVVVDTGGPGSETLRAPVRDHDTVVDATGQGTATAVQRAVESELVQTVSADD